MKHSFERIIASHPDDEIEAEIKKQADEKLQKNADKRNYSDTKDYELEITEKEHYLIDLANTYVDNVLQRYDIQPKEIDLKNIHILSLGSIKKVTDNKLDGAFTTPLTGRIVTERKPTEIEFILSIAHEILHQKEPKAARVVKSKNEADKKKVEMHRTGIEIFDRENKKVWFGSLEEAIVTELTNEILESELAGNIDFKDDIKATKRLKDRMYKLSKNFKEDASQLMTTSQYIDGLQSIPNADSLLLDASNYAKERPEDKQIVAEWSFISGSLGAAVDDNTLTHKHRYKEVKKLHEICTRIHTACPDIYDSERDVFKALVTANYTGDILQLARNIEKAFGKGSFRKLGEETSSNF